MDTDRQADEAWILGVQRKLYQWSQAHPNDAWRDMWGWLTDPRILRHAWRRVASNRGAHSAGIDGVTADSIRKKGNEQRFLDRLHAELRSGAYRPSPSRRKLIPKTGKPGQFRPLGIPTVKDRVVQGAVLPAIAPAVQPAVITIEGRPVDSEEDETDALAPLSKEDSDAARLRAIMAQVVALNT